MQYSEIHKFINIHIRTHTHDDQLIYRVNNSIRLRILITIQMEKRLDQASKEINRINIFTVFI